MEYRTLGSSGTVVSTYALGTMTFGNETDEAGSHEQLYRYVEAGGNFVDTADVYTTGASENIIGSWLAKSGARDSVVLATKGRFPMGELPNDVGTSRRHLRKALDASLTRLGVDHVDLYQLHAWDPITPLQESLSFLEDAVRAGKILYGGVSNFTGWQLQKACDLIDRRGWSPLVTLQPQYNLLVREIEWEIIPAAQENGLGLLPWSPLGGGWLTGKYSFDEEPTGATRLGEDPEPWRRVLASAQPEPARPRRCRGGPRDRRRSRQLDGPDRAGLARGPPGDHVGHSRRQNHRATRRQPRRGRPAPHARGDRAARPSQRPGRGRLPVRRSRYHPTRPPHRRRPRLVGG